MTDQQNNNGGPARRIAIFDLDRTITRIGTFTPFLLSTRRSTAAKASLLAAIAPKAGAYRAGRLTRTELKDHMLSFALDRFSEEEIGDFSDRFVTRHIAGGLFKGAVETIRRHQACGDHLFLATAAVDFYAALFAERLGFETLVATRTQATAEGRRVAGVNCYGDEKRRRVEEAVSEKLGGDIGAYHVTFYTDHHSDFPLMAKATEAIAVNPLAKMRKLAAAENYTIANWNEIHREPSA